MQHQAGGHPATGGGYRGNCSKFQRIRPVLRHRICRQKEESLEPYTSKKSSFVNSNEAKCL
jgi:hypothetical protein